MPAIFYYTFYFALRFFSAYRKLLGPARLDARLFIALSKSLVEIKKTLIFSLRQYL